MGGQRSSHVHRPNPNPETKNSGSGQGIEDRSGKRLNLSKHAEERVQQRGFKPSDLELIFEYGTHTNESTVLRKKDVEEAASRLKHDINRLYRLAGSAVIVQDNTILSIYRPSKAKRRRMLSQAI